jgi:hypothetical protein
MLASDSISFSPALFRGALDKNPQPKSDGGIYFVICNSCYWCTSVLDGTRLSVIMDNNCPSCKSQLMESIPVRSCEDSSSCGGNKSTMNFDLPTQAGKEVEEDYIQ